MTDELKQATERTYRYLQTGPISAYQTENPIESRSLFLADVGTVLREIQSQEAAKFTNKTTPATVEWLEGVGVHSQSGRVYFDFYEEYKVIQLRIQNESGDDECTAITNPTRHQVLCLMEALGVEGKEGGAT